MSDFLTKHNIKKIDRQLEYVKRQIVKLDSSDDAKEYFGERLTYYKQSLFYQSYIQAVLSYMFLIILKHMNLRRALISLALTKMMIQDI